MLELNLANGNIKRRTDVDLEPSVVLDNIWEYVTPVDAVLPDQ